MLLSLRSSPQTQRYIYKRVMVCAQAVAITLLYIYLCVWGLDLRLNNINYSYWYFPSSIIITSLYWTSGTPLSSSITTSEYLICDTRIRVRVTRSCYNIASHIRWYSYRSQDTEKKVEDSRRMTSYNVYHTC